MSARDAVRVFCPSCRRYRRAEVRVGGDFPVTTSLDPHRLDETLDRLGQAAGQAFAIAVARGDLRGRGGVRWAALGWNDPEEDRLCQ